MANKKRHEIQKWRLTFCQLMTHSLVFGKVGLLQVNSSHSVKQVKLILHNFCMFENVAAELQKKRAPRSYRHLAAKFETWFNFSKTKQIEIVFVFQRTVRPRTIVPSVIFLSLSHVKNFIAESRPQKSRAVRKPARCVIVAAKMLLASKNLHGHLQWDKSNKNSGATFDGAAHKKLRHEIYFFFRRAATLCRPADAVCLLCAIGRPVSPIHRQVTKCFANGNSFDLIAVVFFRLRIVSARLYPKGIRPVTLILIFERFWAYRHFCDTRKKSCCFPYAWQCPGEIVDWHQHKLSDC